MDAFEIASEFFLQNAEKIFSLGRQTFGSLNEASRVKLKLAYKQYLSATQKKYSRAKSFFIRHEPVDLYTYYVPTGIACGKVRISVPTFDNCLRATSRIILSGSGGSGKSVALRHLFLDCIQSKKYVPVLLELRDLNGSSTEITLEDFINNTLDAFGFDTSGGYVRRAKEAGHFAFFFDGYDEVNLQLRKQLMTQISSLSKQFPQCPIFLSSRPDDILSGHEEFSIFGMCPLDLDSAVRLVEKLPFDEEIKSKFAVNLRENLFNRHKSFLSNPLLLSIMLLTYGENADIPSKLSIFYEQAYEALFQRHDAHKGGYSRKRNTSLDIQDFSRVFALFSLQTYEKRMFKMSRTQALEFIERGRDRLEKNFKPDDYLSDLLSAACLLVEDGLEVAFSHRSFQEYFVALHISSAAPEIQKKLLHRYWRHMDSDSVVLLLLEINPDLIERELFLPLLGELFENIGATRNITIMHLMRYLRLTYSRFTIENDGVRATHVTVDPDLSTVLRLAVEHCGTFVAPSEAEYDGYAEEVKSKFMLDDEETIYETKVLNHRSPLILELASSPGYFSLEYLSAGFDTYKSLKMKHKNTIQSLDSLLGI